MQRELRELGGQQDSGLTSRRVLSLIEHYSLTQVHKATKEGSGSRLFSGEEPVTLGTFQLGSTGEVDFFASRDLMSLEGCELFTVHVSYSVFCFFSGSYDS